MMSLLFNMLSRLIIAFLPRSKHLLISWLQSPSADVFRGQANSVSQTGRCKTIEEMETETEMDTYRHSDSNMKTPHLPKKVINI